MTEMNINKELSVLVIPNTVYLNKTDITLKISKKAGSEFYKRVAKDDFYGIALAVMEGSTEGLYGEDDFYRVGTLVRIDNAKAMRDFYQIKMEIIERVEVEELIPEGANYRATYRLIPDIMDLEPENEEDIIKHIKYLVSEISENFKGSKTYVEQVNKLDDITKIIAYVFPYMRISLEEKQALLEIRSLKEKSLKFLDILIEQKEAIKFQMEMATKFNEEMSKRNRENMLKEQLRAIQEELDDVEGGSGKKDYKQLIEEADMPEDVKEVALE